MTASKRILIGGGVRSGKSAFALALARQLGRRRAFVATAQGLDDEMRARVARQQAERGGDFRTIEEPVDLPAVLGRLHDVDVTVVDCVTLWLSNLLVRGDDEAAILARVDELVATLAQVRFHVVVVTNEVGMGVHPETAVGRLFRDVAGRAHQRLARCADEIYFAALGVMIRLAPEPIGVVTGGDRS
jgi:adenosylcobinamide kinase/adenosylcobinamide-phosphate guanylyltransferase